MPVHAWSCLVMKVMMGNGYFLEGDDKLLLEVYIYAYSCKRDTKRRVNRVKRIIRLKMVNKVKTSCGVKRVKEVM